MNHESQGIRGEKFHHPCERHLTALVDMLERRIPYLQGRSLCLAKASLVLGRSLRFEPRELYFLALSARIHDIGLHAIPDALLMDPRPLDEARRRSLSVHTKEGGRLVASLCHDMSEVVESIWWHHERPDGGGPYGLRGNEIPVFARVVGLLQAVESMANPRPYQKAMPLSEIRGGLERGKGGQFDSGMVDAFLAQADRLYDLLRIRGNPSPAPPAPARLASSPPSADPSESARIPASGSAVASDAAVSPSTRRPPPTMSPTQAQEKLIKKVEEGLELHPLAGTVQNVLAITGRSQCTAEEVAQAISQDQALSVRVLKLASSSVYSRGKTIHGIREAVQRVGIAEIRNLTMTLSVMHGYEGRITEHIDPWMFWEHSIACGVIARAVGEALKIKRTDDLFLWGVLHDVGRLMMIEHAPEQYASVWPDGSAECGTLDEEEKKIFNMDHCDVLERAMEHWRFPRDFVVPVAQHHSTVAQVKRLSAEVQSSCAAVAFGNRFAHALLLGSSGDETIFPLDEWMEFLRLDEDTLVDIAAKAPDETKELKVTMLARTHLDAWPAYADQLRKSLKRVMRPLHATVRPKSNPYRMFFDRVAGDRADEPPNLGVLYLREAKDLDVLIGPFEAEEKARNAEKLPLLVIQGRGKPNVDHAWLKSRKVIALGAPTPIPRILHSVESLLTG